MERDAVGTRVRTPTKEETMGKWVLGLIVAAALVAVGCGSDDDGGDSGAAKSDGPVTIESSPELDLPSHLLR